MREVRKPQVSPNDIKIAVLEEQMRTMQKHFEERMQTMQKHVENIESLLKTHMETSAEKNNEIMKTLNKGMGAFTFAMLAFGGIGFFVSEAFDYFSSK